MKLIGKFGKTKRPDDGAPSRTQDMAVLTMNRRHFVRLHAEFADHAGIIASCTPWD